jgi:NAD(P)-dependent dehydrogenase (short-subunit alcohol dehydrogenase family)
MTQDLQGKVALVTGASRGVGAAVARVLASAGARVGLASRTEDDLGIEGAVAVACDVRSMDQVQAAVDATVEAFGRLDIVVANAGIGSYGDFLDIPLDEVDAMIDVNLKGTLYTARASLPHLVAAGGGDFLSLASVAGLRGFPGETVYNASKFGMVGFTRSLDHEMREHGVRCTSLCPGGIATDFAMGTGRTPDMPELEGMMSAEDVAEFVLFTGTRPRSLRMLTVSWRPMNEASWG